MSEFARTKKIRPLEIGNGVELPTPNPHRRLAAQLEGALLDAEEVGNDIHDAILKLIASTRRRELEQLPDITEAAEAA